MSRVRLTSNGFSVSSIFSNTVNLPIHRNMSRARLTSNGLSVLVNFLKYGKFAYTQDYEPSQIDFKLIIHLSQFSQIWYIHLYTGL